MRWVSFCWNVRIIAQWMKTSGNVIPENAVRGGYEKDGGSLFIARVKMADGCMTPGKIGRHLTGAHIPYDGKEVIVDDFEVLVHPVMEDGYYEWLSSANGAVPDGAVAADENMYVDRFKYEGGLHPGKVVTSHEVCYVSYAGKELHNKQYEVLCRVK